MHIGILQCDSVDASLQPEFGDYPDMHRHLLTTDVARPHPTFQVYNLTASQFPQSIDECDAWLFTGSKWSANDPDEWIDRARQFARDLHARRHPAIGICFGHQLICQALGGTVEKASAGWGVGVHKTRILERRPWMEPHSDALSLLVSHQDQVTRPPVEAKWLASHPFCPYDMLEIDGHILTLQGHPEFPKNYSRAVMDMRREVIGEITFHEGIESLEQPVDSSIAANWIIGFLRRSTGSF